MGSPYASVFRPGLFAGQAAIVNIIADMWHGMPTMGHSGAAREMRFAIGNDLALRFEAGSYAALVAGTVARIRLFPKGNKRVEVEIGASRRR